MQTTSGRTCPAAAPKLAQRTTLTTCHLHLGVRRAPAGAVPAHSSQRSSAVSMVGSLSAQPRARAALVVRADGNSGGDDKPFVKNTEFGYSRKDILLIGAGLTGLGAVLYYGLQAGGMDAGMAGNWVQLVIILGMSVGWVGSYLWRVANKDMTYVKQLEEYEDAVMRKRWEEMPEAEAEAVMALVQKEKEERAARGKR